VNPTGNQEAFSFEKITKRFGAVLANSEVSFSVTQGTIHGVVGENGAGKSTIMKVLYGMFPPDSGTLRVNGVPTEIPNPERAISLGLGMVHQHFMLVPTQTVWENIILGKEPSLGRLNKTQIRTHLEELKSQYGFTVDLNARIDTLSVGYQQQVEILKVLYRQARILILDEPTAVLTPQEVDSLFEKLKALKQSQKTIVIITHKLKEILRLTDSVTVMRQGKSIETLSTSLLNEETLAEKIIGRKRISLTSQPQSQSQGHSPTLEVQALTVSGSSSSQLKQVSFQLFPGEIVGIAGIEGNGQQELIEVLSRTQENYSGTVTLNQKSIHQFSTYEIKQKGFSLIPPDRHREGVILSFSLSENAILGHHREPHLKEGPFLSTLKRDELAKTLIREFDVRPSNPDLLMSQLSGGNQQKLVVARETLRPVSFLLAAHPTRGIDIGAIDFIHQHLLNLKSKGAAILLISSELEEILKLSDRILVLYQGKIVAETQKDQANERQLGLWMTRGENVT
jgi:general nucleoside transport system ATP-binding protein